MAEYRFQGVLAPIVLFTYARPDHTRRVLDALMANPEAKDSTLYIFCDGARANASDEVKARIAQTRTLVQEQQWCGTVHIVASEVNKGLTRNIVEGVSQVVNQYGKVIVLEDDTEPNPHFLDYMNHALAAYAKEDKVWHVSAYVAPIPEYERLESDTFLLQQGTCWGWGTWSRAWRHYNNDPKFLLDTIYKKGDVRGYNLDGSYPFEWHLADNVTGKLNTWNCKWQAVMFLNGALGVHPRKSLVTNIGIDGTGENCSNEVFYLGPTSERQIEVAPIHPAVEHKQARAWYAAFYTRNFGVVGPSRQQEAWGHFKRRLAKIKRAVLG